ncbi:MAG: helix-turn-helix transcriptional regulator [Clostridia bacterium]|nr:helix-turn-helix transcriptional regulator [Clostridia bacterium]
MTRLRVTELLQEKGKTKYWLYMQLGMSYQNFNNMVNNKTQSIRYDRIEALCNIFECTPNDLFEITDDEPEKE